MAKSTTKNPAVREDESMTPPPQTTALAEYDYGDDEGKGFEHQTSADSSIPFIVLFQALTPMVVEGAKDDAKPGNWYNTVTEQIWKKDEGFLFVPATTRHQFAEWTPRDEGGGFHGNHEIDSPIVLDALKRSTKFGKYTTEDGSHILKETFYVYGIICDENNEPEGMGLMSFWSTKIKSYKAWMSRIHRVRTISNGKKKKRPPLYAHYVRVTSELKKFKEGPAYVPVIGPGHPGGMIKSLIPPDDERFEFAKACCKLVDSGAAKVDFSKQNAADDDGADDDSAQGENPGRNSKSPFG